MIKFLSAIFLFSFCGASVIQIPFHPLEVEASPLENEIEDELWNKWGHHVTDFLDLVDLEKVLDVVWTHINDPDLANFLEFIFSDGSKKLFADIQTVEEFKEAVNYLHSKGYNAQAVIDIINSQLDTTQLKTQKKPERFGSGTTDLIEDIVHVLPVDKIKELFKTKLQNDPDVAKLFEDITTPEFRKILEKMMENPKFLEIKQVFEGYGFDFKRLWKVAEEVVGDFFVGLV